MRAGAVFVDQEERPLVVGAAERIGRDQPMAGAISDRWSSPLGRRRPFIIAGTVGDVIFLVGLALSGSYGPGFLLLAVPGLAAMGILLRLKKRVPDPAVYEAPLMQPPTTPKVPRVVVVGGGFGGLEACRDLAGANKRGQLELTLIDKENFFQFNPLLPEVARRLLLQAARTVADGGDPPGLGESYYRARAIERTLPSDVKWRDAVLREMLPAASRQLGDGAATELPMSSKSWKSFAANAE